ncbi:unnamed protein product, partial [Heterotrigona itama]
MGTMPLANIQEYWSKNQASHITFYPKRLQEIDLRRFFWMLHAKIVSAQSTNSTRLQQISGYLDYINSKFLNYFIPSEEICVDESVAEFRLSHIIRKNQRNEVFESYTLADSNTGYICGILPYYGSLTTQTLIRPDLPVSSRIPLYLYTMLLNKSPDAQEHHMFTDRYYTSYILNNELRKLKYHLTGTILTNRKELPNAIRKPNLKQKLIIAYRKNNNLQI